MFLFLLHRTDNAIKNHWNSAKRRLSRAQTPPSSGRATGSRGSRTRKESKLLGRNFNKGFSKRAPEECPTEDDQTLFAALERFRTGKYPQVTMNSPTSVCEPTESMATSFPDAPGTSGYDDMPAEIHEALLSLQKLRNSTCHVMPERSQKYNTREASSYDEDEVDTDAEEGSIGTAEPKIRL